MQETRDWKAEAVAEMEALNRLGRALLIVMVIGFLAVHAAILLTWD